MANISFSEASGLNDSAYGKIQTPLRMVIQHESDILTKRKDGVVDVLFINETSKQFGETIVGGNEFDDFAPTPEGAGAESDTVQETFRAFISHIQFMKEFSITAQMIEDAVTGIASDARKRAENFARAYYKTRNRIASTILQNATQTQMTVKGTVFDIAAPKHVKDSVALPLFHNAHKVGIDGDTQSNYFYTTALAADKLDTSYMEAILTDLVCQMRGMKDENGDGLGYTANWIILPYNLGGLESIVKKTVGSDGSLGNGYNDINLHSGKWNVFVDPFWRAEKNTMLIMSEDANKYLSGNMFFDRTPLEVESFIDHHTRNNIWNGRARFGVGFGSYKHIIRLDCEGGSGKNATALSTQAATE